MKKRDFIGYVLSLAVVLLYPFLRRRRFQRLDSICFEVESSGLRMDGFMCRSSIFPSAFSDEQSVCDRESERGSDILFNYISLEVSSASVSPIPEKF
ncbi:MAG: hypothetical protein ACLSFJ_01955 [Holdemania filiformis]